MLYQLGGAMSWSKKATSAFLLVWLAAPVTTVAQFSGTYVGVGGGGTIPVGDFHSSYLAAGYGFRVGWQVMAFASFRIPHTPVGLRLHGSYSLNTSDDLINGEPVDGTVSILGSDADLTVTLPTRTRVKVYMLGGRGRHKVTLSFRGQVSGATPTNFAWNTGAGVTVGALFFEVRYVHIDGVGFNFPRMPFVAVTVGRRLAGWSF
jgi:hypothetical protein